MNPAHSHRNRTAEPLCLNLRKIQKTAAELAHFKTRSCLRTDTETLRLNLRKIQKTVAEFTHFKTRSLLRTEAETLRLKTLRNQKTAAAFLHAASLAKRSSSPWGTARATHFAVYARVALR